MTVSNIMRDRLPLAGVYAFLAAFALLAVGPYIWIVLASFKDNSEIFQNPFGLPDEWLVGNYPEAWVIGKFAQYYKNTIIVAALSVGIMVPLVSLAAYPFAKLRFPGQKILLGIMLFGLAVPFQSYMVSLYYTLRSLHILNSYFAMVLPLVCIQIPFGVFYMRAFYLAIPTDLLDAARVDGASELGVLARVVIPMSRAALVSLAIFETVFAWNAFMIPLLYVHTGELRTITLGLMYFSGEYATNYSLTTAGAIIVSLPLLIIFLIFRRGFIRGLATGALK